MKTRGIQSRMIDGWPPETKLAQLGLDTLRIYDLTQILQTILYIKLSSEIIKKPAHMKCDIAYGPEKF